ncbi:hypothetical protein OG921_24195 [Aldersonia sp. NBC_00410]|uniref:hypothetical protein n=1 Tax=Aldersonia sp. NBC_00410 TaxID=2975954 RepID=UPI00225022EF|nr:hypothetical protein [Aldersonia sp. NBC_00410]MCX5046277.1 hypothetical protein [Aldersonia sp. NBC_00410]
MRTLTVGPDAAGVAVEPGQTDTPPSTQSEPARGRRGAAAAIVVLSVLVVALAVALIVSLATRPSSPPDPGAASASALTPAQATKQTCDSFATALDSVVAAGKQYRPASWSFEDPDVDTWIAPYVAAADQAVLKVRVEPDTDPAVAAAVTDWTNTRLMSSAAVRAHDSRSLDTVDDRVGAAEIAARQVCGQR